MMYAANRCPIWSKFLFLVMPMQTSPERLPYAEVLSAGFSKHTKPFHINLMDGLSDYLFRLQTEGSCHAWVEGQLCPILPGDLLLYKPGDPYELVIGKGDTGVRTESVDYFLFAGGSWIDEWWQRKLVPAKINIPLDESILSVWRQIIHEKRKLRNETKEITDYLLRILCLSFDRVISERAKHPANSSLYAAYQIKDYIERHATEPLTLEQIAGHVGLSVSRAVHLFKAAFGQSMMDYAIEVRLSIACERIEFSAMTLEQAAEAAGFRSYSYFHRTFKSRFGISPKQYRYEKCRR
jgi:AraC family transcriptional regulator of arabinose operon